MRNRLSVIVGIFKKQSSPLSVYHLLVICLILAMCMTAACSADEQLWQLGECDNSYAEFAISGNFMGYKSQFPNGAKFEIGLDDPSKSWPYIQPAPVDQSWAGSGEHKHEIVFYLDSEPKGSYIVKLDIFATHGFFGSLVEVSVNRLAQTVEVKPGGSDMSLSDLTKGVEQIVQVRVPAAYLRKGRNTVTLSSIDGSWLLYDCISFHRSDDVSGFPPPLEVESTLLFKQTEAGLRQILLATVDIHPDSALVTTEISGDGMPVPITTRQENTPGGRRKIELEIPPIQKEQKLRVKVAVDGEVHEAECIARPEKLWKVYLLPSSHFDHGYTHIQPEAVKIHRDNIDRVMEWTDKYPEFAWQIESSFVAEDYLRNGSNVPGFLKAAKDGRFSIHGFYGNELTGVCSGESLVRLVDFYDVIKREHGIASECAMQNDVPTMVATIPMILSGHGIKYLSHGINPARAGYFQEMSHTPFYWESPDGSRVLTWKVWGSYSDVSGMTGMGDRSMLEPAKDRIRSIISGFNSRTDYPFDAILLHGGYGDNTPIGEAIAAIPAQWNANYAYPKLIFCGGKEFFEYIEANFKNEIKTVKGDGGIWWEDGVGSSACETAITRAAKEKLITAEKIASLCEPSFQKSVMADFSEAWKNILLYDEHTWGAGVSIDTPEAEATIEQWAIKKSFADNSKTLANKLLEQSITKFISNMTVDEDSVLVFNPSGWSRSGVVSVAGRKGVNMNVIAEDVPPLGYKIIPVSESGISQNRPDSGNTLENSYYRIEFDHNTGAISSIFDKELNRELADTSGGGLNAFLYVSGGVWSQITHNIRELPNPELKIDGCSGASLKKIATSEGRAMEIACAAPMAKGLRARIVLHDREKRIDFINELDKTATYAKEAGYFAFPFAFTNPKIRIEIPNGVIRPDIDQFPGACRDWYGVQHFMTISDNSAAVAWVPWDSPLVTLQDINRGQWQKELKLENGSIFAYVFNNYWWTNYKASQDGKLVFRFSMTSAKSIDDLSAKKFGESVQSPLVAKFIPGKPGKQNSSSRACVEMKGSGVVIQAIKPARFTEGVTIRLREMSGGDSKITLIPHGIPFKRARLCNLAEDVISDLAVKDGSINVKCRALGLTTILLER